MHLPTLDFKLLLSANHTKGQNLKNINKRFQNELTFIKNKIKIKVLLRSPLQYKF